MPLFVGDLLADTMHLSRSEIGGYMLMIMAYWQQGEPLADDDVTLRRITRSTRYAWQKLRKNLHNFFTVVDGAWHHKRIDQELEKVRCRKGLAPPHRHQPSRAGAASQIPNQIKNTPATPGAPEQVPRAPAGRAPPAAGVSIFERARELLGSARAGLVGSMLKTHGADRVQHALDEVDRARPRSPPAFFRAICEGRQAQPPPPVNTVPQGPPRRLTDAEIAAIYARDRPAAAAA